MGELSKFRPACAKTGAYSADALSADVRVPLKFPNGSPKNAHGAPFPAPPRIVGIYVGVFSHFLEICARTGSAAAASLAAKIDAPRISSTGPPETPSDPLMISAAPNPVHRGGQGSIWSNSSKFSGIHRGCSLTPRARYRRSSKSWRAIQRPPPESLHPCRRSPATHSNPRFGQVPIWANLRRLRATPVWQEIAMLLRGRLLWHIGRRNRCYWALGIGWLADIR